MATLVDVADRHFHQWQPRQQAGVFWSSSFMLSSSKFYLFRVVFLNRDYPGISKSFQTHSQVLFYTNRLAGWGIDFNDDRQHFSRHYVPFLLLRDFWLSSAVPRTPRLKPLEPRIQKPFVFAPGGDLSCVIAKPMDLPETREQGS